MFARAVIFWELSRVPLSQSIPELALHVVCMLSPLCLTRLAHLGMALWGSSLLAAFRFGMVHEGLRRSNRKPLYGENLAFPQQMRLSVSVHLKISFSQHEILSPYLSNLNPPPRLNSKGHPHPCATSLSRLSGVQFLIACPFAADILPTASFLPPGLRIPGLGNSLFLFPRVNAPH